MSSSVHQLSIRFHPERVRDLGRVRFYLDPVSAQEVEMQIEDFDFGSIRIDGITHEHDVVIEGGEIRKRKKKPSKKREELDILRCLSRKSFPGSAAGW